MYPSDWKTHNLGIFIFIRIGLHIPDDLMSEKLRELGRLEDESLNVSQRIISQGLYNLRDIKEGDINRVTLQRSHSVLQDESVIRVRREEVSGRGNWIDWSPIQKVLLNHRSVQWSSLKMSSSSNLQLKTKLARDLIP